MTRIEPGQFRPLRSLPVPRVAVAIAVLFVFGTVLIDRGSGSDDAAVELGPNTPSTAARSEVTRWLLGQVDESTAEALLTEHWPGDPIAELSPLELHDRVIAIMAAVDLEVQAIVDACREPSRRGEAPDLTWLAETGWPTRIRGTVALHVGRWLTQEAFYDQALAILEPLNEEEVFDPSTLFFCRGACKHLLVQLEASQDDLALLRMADRPLPRRYEELAALMDSDASDVEDESLDHIARRMDDIRRRLDQGSTDERVMEVEDGVIESLDKLIKKLEEQARQQQQMAQQSGGGSSPTPMQDSMPGGGRGPGNVDRRDIGDRAGWGDLPEKQREAALHQVSRDFPAHYRQLIEQYFRRLAGDSQEESR